MARKLKEYLVDDIASKVSLEAGFLALECRGLNAEETFDLRKTIWEAGGSLRVVHNRLTKRVVKSTVGEAAENGAGQIADAIFRGPTALVLADEVGVDGVVALARSLSEWKKKHAKKLELKGGLVCGELLGRERVEGLASMPDQKTLYSQVAGLAQSPLRNVASAAQQVLLKIVYAANALKEKLEAE